MKPELLTIGKFCLCAADVFMIDSFFRSMFERRVGRCRSIVYFIITAAVLFLENAFGNSIMNLMLVPVIFLLYSVTVFRISPGNGIVYTLVYYIIFGAGRELAFELLYRLVSMVSPYGIAPWFTPYGMQYLTAEYLLSFLFLLFIERFTSRMDINGDDKFCWYFLIMPITSIMILISYFYMDFPESGFIAAIMCGGTFLLYFSNAAIFIILGNYTETMNRIKMSQLSELKKDMEKANYESIDKANSVYRKHLHDMHQYFNQFRNLAARGQNQMIVDIVDELEGKLKIEESSIIYSSDTVLNVLLVEYCGRAKEMEIDMTVFVEDGLYLSFISDGDKISLFGNLLANALEASEKCQEDKRSVDVKIYMGNSYFLVFQVRNTHIMEAHKEGDHFLTTKRDAQNHGLGIKIVEELAEKYGGTLELEMDESYFTATLMVSSYHK